MMFSVNAKPAADKPASTITDTLETSRYRAITAIRKSTDAFAASSTNGAMKIAARALVAGSPLPVTAICWAAQVLMCSETKVAMLPPQPSVRNQTARRCGRYRSAQMKTTVQNASVGSASQAARRMAAELMPGITPPVTGTSAVIVKYCENSAAV